MKVLFLLFISISLLFHLLFRSTDYLHVDDLASILFFWGFPYAVEGVFKTLLHITDMHIGFYDSATYGFKCILKF